MKNIGIVQGSLAQAQPLVIGKNVVYVHNNIVEKTDEDGRIYYEYEEIQYDKDEYLKKIFDENELIKDVLDTLIMEG